MVAGLIVFSAQAQQFTDDFDGSLKSGYTPVSDWILTKINPIRGIQSLKHNLSGISGQSFIFHPVELNFSDSDLEWNFTLQNGNWDPSSTNRFWFYLATDSGNTETLTGYAAGVNIKGTDDILSIWKITNGIPDSLILESDLDWNENMAIDVKINRSAPGKWELWYKPVLNNSFQGPWAGEERCDFKGRLFGLFFQFTSTRAGQFWADDITISGKDAPPYVKSAEAVDSKTIQVYLNESLKGKPAIEDIVLKRPSGETIPVVSLEWPASGASTILLETVQSPDGMVLLEIRNLEDLNGNRTGLDTFIFRFSPPVYAFDIIINELMVDPAPVVGLPEQEYLELFNQTSSSIQLNGWKLTINGNEKVLGETLIQGNGYLLLCSTGAATLFSSYGNVLPVPGFPGLLNKGSSITLINDKGLVIDQIVYSESWYRDDSRKNGGWSLERIDPERHCGQQMNWRASDDLKGGTPGSINSVYAKNPDNDPPLIRWVAAVSADELQISFSEPMDTLKFRYLNNYIISESSNSTVKVQIISASDVKIGLKENLNEGKNYTFHVRNLTDECNNLMAEAGFPVQWSSPAAGDFVINEVLFNPYPGGEDFVEIYNNSSKRISKDRFFLATRDNKGELKQLNQISPEKYSFEPGTFIVCTTDSDAVLNFYTSCSGCFEELNAMPGYSNDKGIVVLLDEKKQVLDEFPYSEKMHHPALYNPEGVSLERIIYNAFTGDPSNWQSAASYAGYATPGFKNSQAANDQSVISEVTFDPEAISPNNDGYNDALNIGYQFKRAGMVANCTVFDTKGRFVMSLKKNEILGTNGSFTWNGEDETGRKLSPGIYVVLLEVYEPHGFTKRYKKAVVLTDRFE